MRRIREAVQSSTNTKRRLVSAQTWVPKIKETAILLAIPIYLIFDGQIIFLYSAALYLDYLGPGEKIRKESTVGVILMGSQFCEHVLKVIITPEPMGFGGLYTLRRCS